MSVKTNIGTFSAVPARIVLGGGPRTILLSANSELELSHRTVFQDDCLTAFDVVIPLLGLTNDTQGQPALLHALLKIAGLIAKRSDTPFNGPCQEVLSRLEQAGINPHALAYIRQYMNTASEAYSRRSHL